MAEGNLYFDPWEPENLRVSLFQPPSSTELWRRPDLPDLWESVTGAKPNSVDSRPKERMTRVEGNTAEGHLFLFAQSRQGTDQVSWLVIGEPANIFPVLRNVSRSLDLLRDATNRSLGKFPLVARLAFGAVLSIPAPNPALGLERLSGFLPSLELDSMQGADFIYRVNRPRRSTASPHVRVNRLAKWSVAQVGNIEVTLAAEPTLSTSNVGFATRLELDINNDPRSGAVSKEKVPGLLNELVDLANELSLKGDIQ